ncbi:MAG: cytochrome c peroxidase [Gemmatimonadota bacterium]
MKRVAFVSICSVLVLVGCDGRVTESDPIPPSADALLRQSIGQWGVIPIGEMPPQNPALVTLGRALFFDKVLSGNRDVSCATCHQPGKALGDGMSLAVGTGAIGHISTRAPGVGRTFVPRQSPSLLNAGLGMFYVFWDGRLRSNGPGSSFLHGNGPTLPPGLNNILVAQAMLPVLNRQEMRGNAGDVDVFGAANELAQISDAQATAIWAAVMKRLIAIPEYVDMFAVAFPGRPISQLGFEDAARALAAFEMQAFTKVRSPFDQYLGRDDGALTAEQKRGAALFFGEARCAQCHGGPFLGGQTFANAGVPQIGPGLSKQPPLDFGRGEVENNTFYNFAFRAAPLRNVELTSPYMHNGAYPTLEAVVDHYSDATNALRTYDVSQLDPALRPLVHGDQTTVNNILNTLDFRLRQPLDFTDDEKRELVAFLKALTDPAARDLSPLILARVPSGLPVQ